MPAVKATGGRLEGWVSFEPEPGWEVQRNYRFLGSHHLALEPAGGAAVLTVDLIRVGRRGRDLPLDLVAEGVVGELGRGMGISTRATRRDDVDLGGHHAVALSGTRTHGPRQVAFTTLVARTERHLVLVSLQSEAGDLHRHVRAMERLLWTFSLPALPPPPATLPDR